MSNVGFVINVDSEKPVEAEVCEIVLAEMQDIDHHVVFDDLTLKVRVTEKGILGYGQVPMRHEEVDLICTLLQTRIERKLQELLLDSQGEASVSVGPLPEEDLLFDRTGTLRYEAALDIVDEVVARRQELQGGTLKVSDLPSIQELVDSVLLRKGLPLVDLDISEDRELVANPTKRGLA